jgi:hypothetical protein
VALVQGALSSIVHGFRWHTCGAKGGEIRQRGRHVSEASTSRGLVGNTRAIPKTLWVKRISHIYDTKRVEDEKQQFIKHRGLKEFVIFMTLRGLKMKITFS